MITMTCQVDPTIYIFAGIITVNRLALQTLVLQQYYSMQKTPSANSWMSIASSTHKLEIKILHEPQSRFTILSGFCECYAHWHHSLTYHT